MTVRFGILAEDETDCDAVATLVRRVAFEVNADKLGLRKHWFKGCARLRTKASTKLAALAKEGFNAAVVVHDLDRDPANNALNDEVALRSKLEAIEAPRSLRWIVCIPVEELEAWFWADQGVIDSVGHGKATTSPHLVRQPKERLIAISRGANQRPSYTTNDNEALAQRLDLAVCASRCPSFRQLRDFVIAVVTAA